MSVRLPLLEQRLTSVRYYGRRLRRAAEVGKRAVRGNDHDTMRWVIPRYEGTREITRAFYINLDSSPDRRADMDRRLARVGIPFDRFPGINGPREREAYSDYLAQRPALPQSRRPGGALVPYEVTDAMVGCWLSHVHVLKHIATLEEGLYLIFEDDYSAPADLRVEIERLLAEIPDDWDILKPYSQALNGKPALRGVQIADHLVRLGPALFTQQNLSVAIYLVRHEGNRVDRIIDALEATPVQHIDDAVNAIMDDVRIYAPIKQVGGLTPLSSASIRVAMNRSSFKFLG